MANLITRTIELKLSEILGFIQHALLTGRPEAALPLLADLIPQIEKLEEPGGLLGPKIVKEEKHEDDQRSEEDRAAEAGAIAAGSEDVSASIDSVRERERVSGGVEHLDGTA